MIELYLEQLQKKPSAINKKKDEIEAEYKRKKEDLKKNKKKYIEQARQQAINKSTDQMNDEIAGKVNQLIVRRIEKITDFFYKQDELLDIAKSKELQKLEKLQDALEKTKKTAAAAVIAAVVITAANRTYKKYRNNARIKCKETVGEKHKECMKKEVIIALKLRIKELNRQTIRCDKSSDPYACKARVHRYALKIRDKIMEYAKDIGVNILNIE